MKKSSQWYNGIFSIIANLIFDNKKVLKLELKHPLELLQNLELCKWWGNRVARRTELYSYIIKNQDEVMQICTSLRKVMYS